MDWRRDGTKNFYTLLSPPFTCHVWQTASNGWVASIRRSDEKWHKENFPTDEAARTWCEQRIRVEQARKPL